MKNGLLCSRLVPGSCGTRIRYFSLGNISLGRRIVCQFPPSRCVPGHPCDALKPHVWKLFIFTAYFPAHVILDALQKLCKCRECLAAKRTGDESTSTKTGDPPTKVPRATLLTWPAPQDALPPSPRLPPQLGPPYPMGGAPALFSPFPPPVFRAPQLMHGGFALEVSFSVYKPTLKHQRKLLHGSTRPCDLVLADINPKWCRWTTRWCCRCSSRPATWL